MAPISSATSFAFQMGKNDSSLAHTLALTFSVSLNTLSKGFFSPLSFPTLPSSLYEFFSDPWSFCNPFEKRPEVSPVSQPFFGHSHLLAPFQVASLNHLLEFACDLHFVHGESSASQVFANAGENVSRADSEASLGVRLHHLHNLLSDFRSIIQVLSF